MFLSSFSSKADFVRQGVSTGTYVAQKSNSIGVASNTMEADSFRTTNPGIPPIREGGTVGSDAEAYESVSYTATLKKRDHTATCNTIESWKPLKYVVFERANKGDTWCRYSFKVERSNADSVTEKIKALDPEDFTADTNSIKEQVVRYDSELDILLRKQRVLETMLEDAIVAYDELKDLATSIEDVETLTTIINSKLQTIERLTSQRITLSKQIDSLARRSAQLQDDIDYVHYSVTVHKYKVFDGTAIKDSWVRQVQQFVADINSMLQELTLGVLVLLIQLVVAFIYISIVGLALFFFIKYAWRFAKRSWKSREDIGHDEYTDNT